MLRENWDAVRAFLAAQTQWRHVGQTGHVVGLDYAGARQAVRALRADGQGERKAGRRLSWRRVFERLREMEAAAVREMARKAEAAATKPGR